MNRLVGSSLILVLLLVPVAAGADRKQAGRLFTEGQTAAARADYPAAITAFTASYAAHPHPNTLFALARAYDHQFLVDRDLAKARKALQLYQQFSRQRPGTPWSARADAHAAQLRTLLPRQPAPQQSQPASRPASLPASRPVQPGGRSPYEESLSRGSARSRPAARAAAVRSPGDPQPTSSSLSRWLPWTTLGVGLALTAVGVGLQVRAGQLNEEFHDACNSCQGAGTAELRDEGERLEQGGWILVGLGSATVATSVVLWLVLPSDEQRAPVAARRRLAPVLGPGVVGLSLTSEF